MTLAEMTVEHLGSEATEVDLDVFRDLVGRVMDRNIDESEAIELLWGNGDWCKNAVELGVATEDELNRALS